MSPLVFDFAPWRLSGQVIGVLLNHRPALAALGDAVHAPPYKAPPRAPVLYLKPRNTQVADGARVAVPVGVPAPGLVTASATLKAVGWLIRLRAGPVTLIVVAAGFT